MTETEFATSASAVLTQIEEQLDGFDIDTDFERKGDGILEIEFDNGSKIIVNLQAPMQEIWVAAKSGGYHFKFDGNAWRDTRAGTELFAALSEYASQQAGAAVVFTASA